MSSGWFLYVVLHFAYDANGNLTSDGKQTYRYDAQNRLLAVEPVAPATGAVRAEFAYDARNRAVARTYWTLGKAGAWVLNPDDSRALTYDTAWNLLAERTRNGAQVGEYIHGQRTDEVLRAELKPYNLPLVASYPLPDGLGSVVALANDSGKVTERFRYSAYGQPTSLSTTYQAGAPSVSGYRLLFTGRECLGAVGLNEHRNRYYEITSGRWISMDPLGFFAGDRNLFRYCGNDSVGKLDESGLAGGTGAACGYCNGVSYNANSSCCLDGQVKPKLPAYQRLGFADGSACAYAVTRESALALLAGAAVGGGLGLPGVDYPTIARLGTIVRSAVALGALANFGVAYVLCSEIDTARDQGCQ